MDIHPIITAEDHKEAVRTIERLWDAEPGSPDGRLVDVLATLVNDYENRAFPIGEVDPIDTLRSHMEMSGRTQSDLAELFGSKPRASEVLRRRRALTVEMIHKLDTMWHLPAQLLVRPYDLEPTDREAA